MLETTPVDDLASHAARADDELFTAEQLEQRNKALCLQHIDENIKSVEFIERLPLDQKLEHIHAAIELELKKNLPLEDMKKAVDDNLKLIFQDDNELNRDIRKNFIAKFIESIAAGQDKSAALKQMMHSIDYFAVSMNLMRQNFNRKKAVGVACDAAGAQNKAKGTGARGL
jgi:hypothetical protein